MSHALIESSKVPMLKAVEHLKTEFSAMRTGRASPGLVENLMVESYGSQVNIKSVASISIPEANQIVIQPWDKSQLGAIEKAIQVSNIGLNPVNDGTAIRLMIPKPTEEKRKEYVKVAHQHAEQAKIGIRNHRQEAHTGLKTLEKDKKISEDEFHTYEDDLQKVVDSMNTQIDELVKSKEKELLTV